MKNIYLKLLGFIGILNLLILKVFAGEPTLVCNGLPGCKTSDTGGKQGFTSEQTGFYAYIGNIISEMIKYVAVMSLFSLIFAGINYILSMGKDDKANKAKKWIIYSLVGVLISTSSWALINLVNSFSL